MVEPSTNTMLARSVAEPSQQGFAFGVYGITLNAGLFLIPIVVGALKDATSSVGPDSYNGSIDFILTLIGIGIGMLCWAWLVDSKGYITSSAEEYAQIVKE